MKRIDTSKWKEFRLGELFDIKKGTRLTKANMKPGNINYVGATAFNNGVTAKIGNTEHLHPADTLSVCYNGSIGQTFYQTEPFWATDDVNVLYPRFTINRYIAQFIASIIFQIGQKYDYKDKWTTDKMQKTSILLPATPSNEPDWEFMENYMCKYEQQTTISVTALKHLTETHKPKRIDTSAWSAFPLSELFEIKLSEGDNKANLLGEGDIPLISSGSFNNGIAKYINEGDGKSKIFNENVLTVDMFGKAFYQDKPFYAVSHGRVNILEPRFTCNKYIGLFIASIIDSSLYPKYDFKTMCNQSQIQKESINLPATPSGEPDWNLMEQYMRQVEQQVKNTIIALTTPTPQVQQQTNLVNYGTVNIYEK